MSLTESESSTGIIKSKNCFSNLRQKAEKKLTCQEKIIYFNLFFIEFKIEIMYFTSTKLLPMHRFLIALFFISFFAKAQTLPTIEVKTKDMKAYRGLFNFYWDNNTGKIWLQITRLDSEFLYQTSLPAGLGSNDVGLDRGILGNTDIVKFSRVGNKILMIEPNLNYRAVTNNVQEQKAVEQSFAQSVIWGFTIEAESNGSVLVDATDFLLRDAMN